MTIKYLDPYKDDPYGKLRGDKSEAFVRLVIDEGKLYVAENCYILAAMVSSYKGVIRSYKPELSLEKGLCAIPIYGSEYEIRRKDKDGTWISDKVQPSIFEKALYEHIKTYESEWLKDDEHLAGELTFVPNMLCENLDKKEMQEQIDENCKLEGIVAFGDLPAYTPPASYGQRKGYSGAKGVSPEEKLEFVIKQIKQVLGVTKDDDSTGLIDLITTLRNGNLDNLIVVDDFLKILIACAS